MKKFIKWISLTAFIFVILTIFAAFACDIYISSTADKYIVGQKSVSDVDCIVVLGAAVSPDGTVSHALRSRLETTLTLYDDGVSDKILLSGNGKTQPYNEIDVMKAYLLDRGIPQENIFEDRAGYDTYSSVYRAKEIFMLQKPVFVSQKEHLLRAMYFSQQLDLDAKGVACADYAEGEAFNQRIREYGARLKAVLVCDIFHSKPEELGPPTPIYNQTPVNP